MTPNGVGIHKLRITDLGSSGQEIIQSRPTCLGMMLPVADWPPFISTNNQERASHTCLQGNLMEDTLTDCPPQNSLMEVLLQMRFFFPRYLGCVQLQ